MKDFRYNYSISSGQSSVKTSGKNFAKAYKFNIEELVKRIINLAELYQNKANFIGIKGCDTNIDSELQLLISTAESFSESVDLISLNNIVTELNKKIMRNQSLKQKSPFVNYLFNGIKPLFHYSSCRKTFENFESKAQAHADFIYEKINDYGYAVDIEVEAKAKELAVLKYKETQDTLLSQYIPLNESYEEVTI